ncbi:hypothetical protein [Clostridium aciditolerans]|nr:hypothetical protein [Clostridium aciditolerans]
MMEGQNKHMKNKEFNRKILITLSIIFFITSCVVKLYTTKINFKAAAENRTEKNFNSELIKQNKKQMDVDDKARRILELSNTISETIKYIDNSLSKGTFNDIETLTNDSIDALNSIEKALFVQDRKSDLRTKIDLLKSDFQELNNAVKDKDLNKSKQIVNGKMLKDYDDVKNSLKSINN